LMYADDVTALVTSPDHMNRLIEHIQLFTASTKAA
jgi:hypothetical protein